MYVRPQISFGTDYRQTEEIKNIETLWNLRGFFVIVVL